MEKINTGKRPFVFPAWQKGFKRPVYPRLLKKQAIGKKLDGGKLFWFIAAFFIGRSALMGEITPFALIFWALVIRLQPQKKPLVTAAIIIGWATSQAGIFPPWFLPAGMLLWMAMDYLGFTVLKKRVPFSITLPLTVLSLRLPLFYLYGLTIYEFFIIGLEVLLALLLPPLLVPFFEEYGLQRRYKASPEALVGGFLLFSLIILGMSGISLGENIQLLNIVCPLLVLSGAYLWGPVWGVTAGLIIGLCLSFGNPVMFPYTGVLGISGLIAGLLRPFRRPLIALIYFAVLRFLAYYCLEGGYILTTLWEDLTVAGVFLCIPLSLWESLRNISIYWPFQTEGNEKLRFAMAGRIKDFAAVFKELAATFQPLSQAENIRSKRDLSPLVDYFSRRVCSSCDFFERCWQGDLSSQYRRIVTMFSVAEESDKFSEKYIPVRLRRYCPRQREIVKAIGSMKEIYRLNCYWQDRLHESRSLVSEQLEGISSVMHDLAQELKLKSGEIKEQAFTGSIRFLIEIGVAQVAKDGQNITGDSYTVLPLKDGKQAVILSDGMGSGKEARSASLSTVRLMEHLLGIGFRQEIVINTINTLLRLGYPTERFATLDMAMFNLQSAEVELFKLGAPPSFLKNGKAVEVIGSASLPIGILEEITPEKASFKLSNGGLVVMVTDGLLDSRQESEGDWLVNALEEIHHDHPQIIADRLIEEACYRWPRGVQDDLTVLVSRLRPL